METGFGQTFTNEEIGIFKQNAQKQSVIEWLRYGSEFEDISARASNHFHDPLRDSGLDDIFSGESALLWAMGTEGLSQCIIWKMEHQEQWLFELPYRFYNPYCNDYSYRRARNAYYEALTSEQEEMREKNFARLFERLGRVMHLIEDMGVPAHTRNDMKGHLSFKNNGQWMGGKSDDNQDYEGYYNNDPYLSGWLAKTKKWTGAGNLYEYWVENTIMEENAKGNSYTEDLCGKKQPGRAQFSTPEEYWDQDVYTSDSTDPNNTLAVSGEERAGFAEYTSANYLSAGTMFDETESFPFPNLDIIENAPPAIITAEDGKEDKIIPLYKKDGYGEPFDGDPFVAYSYNRIPVIEKYYGNSDQEPLEESYSDPSADYILSLCYVLTDAVHEAYAKRLLPKVVGYTAGLLDYFFRGKMEATVAEIPTDIDPIKLGINKLTISARNITPGEAMAGGALDLVVKYRMTAEDPYRYIRKECQDQCAYIDPSRCKYSIPQDFLEEFRFDLKDSEIPIDAEEITLFLVYRGLLGEEPDGIAVAMIKNPLIPKPAQNQQIVPPESGPNPGVYALLDAEPADPEYEGFDRIAFTVEDGSNRPIVTDDGTVTAVLWYRVSQGNPFQAVPMDQFPRPYPGNHTVTETYYGFNDLNGQTFAIDLADHPVPLWATDLFLYLVYTSGGESFCIMNDLSEPTPVDLYNDTDRICLYGILYDLVDEYGAFDDTACRDAVDAVDLHEDGNGNGKADEWGIYPTEIEMDIRFSSIEDQTPAQYQSPEFNTYDVPTPLQPGNNFRLFIIADNLYFMSIAYQYIPTHPADTFRYRLTLGEKAMKAVVNQDLSRLYDPYCWISLPSLTEICSYNVRYIPNYHPFMGLDTWSLTYFVNSGYPDESCEKPY